MVHTPDLNTAAVAHDLCGMTPNTRCIISCLPCRIARTQLGAQLHD